MNASQPNFCHGSQAKARSRLPSNLQFTVARCGKCGRMIHVTKDGRFRNHSKKGAA